MQIKQNLSNFDLIKSGKRLAQLLLLFIMIELAVIASPWGKDFSGLAAMFFNHQDVYLLLFITGIWLIMSSFKWPSMLFAHFNRDVIISPAVAALISALLFLICYAGHYFILSGFSLSRDELMADYDAEIFARGHLIWPILEQWRGIAPALNQLFIFPIGNQEAWVSAYLPINALFRAGFSFIGDQALTGPFFVAIGALALWNIIKQIWPENPEYRYIGLLLYAGSGQILFNGMTSYAMPGHLALNLVWMALFLKNKFRFDMAALVVGFLATGLHQPLFHPLFAAPILFLLVLHKDWRRAGLYLAGYAVICAFWLYWPIFIASFGQAPIPPDADKVDYLTRLLSELPKKRWKDFWLMFENLMRFAAWQHILLIPLLWCGLRAVFGSRLANTENISLSFPRALAVGFFLPIPIMLILLAYQGHGWGYRYMHGVIGNGILLAIYGWQNLGPNIRRMPLFLFGTAATFFISIPMQSYFITSFYTPYANIDRWINAQDTDLALLDTAAYSFAEDTVRNPYNLSNRPIRLIAEKLKPSDFTALCKDGKSLLVVDHKRSHVFMSDFSDKDYKQPDNFTNAVSAAQESGCVIRR